jgi:WD40 repeat protein
MQKTLIDLSKTNDDNVFAEPVKISTLALSNDETRSVVCIGGMNGEYAYRSLDTYEDQVVVGFATKKTGGIVNHIDIDYHSAASQMHAVISCNDGVVRVLDCETDTFLHAAQDTGTGFGGGFRFGLQKPKFSNGEASGFTYPWPINCSAASPDGKLRVLVGDTCDVIITNTQNGRLERLIKGHHDYCFACAWSPDGNLVVTGGQDR